VCHPHRPIRPRTITAEEPNILKRMTTRTLALAILTSAGIVGVGVGAADAAPSCVSSHVDTHIVTKTFWAHNGCRESLRIRFILAHHADSDCLSIDPGEWTSYTTIRSAELKRTDSC